MDKWLNNRNVLRLIALMIAILLWVIVHMDREVTTPQSQTSLISTKTIQDVKVQKVGLDTELFYIQEINTEHVTVTLRGNKSRLNTVSTKDGNAKIQADLSNLTAGKHVLMLEPIGFPEELDVEIYPDTITVQIEEIEKREFPVKIELLGKPAEGFRTGVPILNPSRVVVSGSNAELSRLKVVRAEVEVEGAKETVQGEYKLTALNENDEAMDIEITPAVVDVELPITSPFKTVPMRIKLIGEPPAGYSVSAFEQSVKQVTVYGDEDVLNEMEFYDGIEIDLTKLTNDKLYSLNIPLRDNVDRIVPETVEVEISVVPSQKKTFEDIPIVFSGENGEYTTRLLEPSDGKVSISVEAAPSKLKGMKAGDIQAILDVSNLPPGTYEETLKLNLPSYVKAKPVQVQLEIVPKNVSEEEIPPEQEPGDRPGDPDASDGTNVPLPPVEAQADDDGEAGNESESGSGSGSEGSGTNTAESGNNRSNSTNANGTGNNIRRE
ncbi:CdaR family protein [Marinicrinis sediminis]|uniref:YbbR-like domain-containing protein n=1 Tax=Marinicrinis sediminis TaxID=1652465 RepID=A0ABW5RF66_9BACL